MNGGTVQCHANIQLHLLMMHQSGMHACILCEMRGMNAFQLSNAATCLAGPACHTDDWTSQAPMTMTVEK